MKINLLAILITVLTLPACAAYQPPALSLDHPAHGDAASAPRPTPSLTLAYTRADMTAPQPVRSAAAAEKETPGKTVRAEGRVVTTIPAAGQLVVEHGEIKGFMDAMTMGYRVEPASLLEGLNLGDKIMFTVDVAKKAIVQIDKIK